jgi:hypothetical protein
MNNEHERTKHVVDCPDCQATQVYRLLTTFANGTRHLELQCCGCGKHIGFAPMPVELVKQPSDESVKASRFGFGKYKDKEIVDVAVKDRGYIEWLLAQKDLKAGMRVKLETALKMVQNGLQPTV